MAVKLEDVREGSIVRVRSGFGDGPIVRGKVVEVDAEGKNGHPTISYDLVDDPDDGGWAYLDQIVSVVTY